MGIRSYHFWQKVSNQAKNKANYALIDLRNAVNKKEIPKKNPDKVIKIVETALDFNIQQKGKGLKILTLKQMLQKFPIAREQVKAGNTSENIRNEISQIIYSLYEAIEITKKVYSNIMNSILL